MGDLLAEQGACSPRPPFMLLARHGSGIHGVGRITPADNITLPWTWTPMLKTGAKLLGWNSLFHQGRRRRRFLPFFLRKDLHKVMTRQFVQVRLALATK
jgi:hypothetical protein